MPSSTAAALVLSRGQSYLYIPSRFRFASGLLTVAQLKVLILLSQSSGFNSQISSTSWPWTTAVTDNGGQMGVDAIDAQTQYQRCVVVLALHWRHTHDRSQRHHTEISNLQMLNRCSALLSPTVGSSDSLWSLRVKRSCLELVLLPRPAAGLSQSSFAFANIFKASNNELTN